MATSRFYLDSRRVLKDGTSPLMLSVFHEGKTFYLSLDMRLPSSCWDNAQQMVINHHDRNKLNLFILRYKQKIDSLILDLSLDGCIYYMSCSELKDRLLRSLRPDKSREARLKRSFSVRFQSFADTKKSSTREIYYHTMKRMQAFVGDDYEKLQFEDITKEWLTRFDLFLSQTSPSQNARNIHFRNIRAVFNEAIDDEITTFYPFRRFKIRQVATRKRSLSIDNLRLLWNYPVDKATERYLDYFKLMFMLIGINLIDLANLKRIRNGRIEYYRSKTNRLYSIKVEPEALEIINKYRGKEWLLDINDRYKNHKDFLHRMNRSLKLIGKVERKGRGGKKYYEPLFPEISTYWSRHTWATIASSIDIPRDTIAHALGHGRNTVTDIYIDFDEHKVDEANRRVIDWVLYSKI